MVNATVVATWLNVASDKMADNRLKMVMREAAKILLFQKQSLEAVTKANGTLTEKLVEYLKAEGDERLLILPCKLGTTLYRICEEKLGRKAFIREVTFNRTNFARIVLDGEVGKTAFLTREEAEQKLEEINNGKNHNTGI
jgi:hypothetical protein